MRAQVSPDYAVSTFIFALVVLFVFISLTRTYYSRAWEIRNAESVLEAEKLAFFLVGDEGNWSSNPFQSSSLGIKGSSGINETKLRYFMGMPYQHVQNKTKMARDFKVEVYELPSIAIMADVEEMYVKSGDKANVTISMETSRNSTLYVVLTGGNVTLGGEYAISQTFTSTGKYHRFEFSLYPGIYTIEALAVGNGYGAYKATFRVI